MTVWTRLADVADDVELFEELATKSLDMRLAGMDLAAGKFPVTGQVRAVGSQRQQERIVVFDDGRDDNDGAHCGDDAPTGTGWIHATLPFDSMTFART